MDINILDSKGKVSGKQTLPESIANAKPDKHLAHEVVTAYLANQRKGTHAVLTRAEVTGGSRKPWKQKHTGRARAGTTRSPLWRKGGIIHGPQPRDYRITLPQAKVRAVLLQALSAKATSGDLIVADAPKLEQPKTKAVTAWLKSLSLPVKSLLVLEKKDSKLSLAARNLSDFEIMERKHLHAYQVLGAKKVVLTPEAAGLLS
ncbi:MAG: 50S ribosomal protein L4 [Elusimicrobia bacterium RIFCSPLOWO2_01_FULL_54_10]|nr:MAG: 50S ribosomal protein L4 [Elusimicrobia bacterium RIFCSPLOWO2_01_FULL_54_10]